MTEINNVSVVLFLSGPTPVTVGSPLARLRPRLMLELNSSALWVNQRWEIHEQGRGAALS